MRVLLILPILVLGCHRPEGIRVESASSEKQITHQPVGHLLTNSAVWSPDGRWIVYDIRSDPAGSNFDGDRIERVNVETGVIETLYQARNEAKVGVVTCCPVDDRVVFIHGPELPTADWSYNAFHRQGAIVRTSRPSILISLDARDVMPPFTPGALRGGSHVHTFDARGEWVAFTYEDHILAGTKVSGTFVPDRNQRNIGVSVPVGPVKVPKTHPRNHDGSHFSVLVTRTANAPRPGSDEISKAYEDAWIATPTGRSLAFLGDVVSAAGQTVTEVFRLDLPDDVRVSGDGPLEGTTTRRPAPPLGTKQHRLTFTTTRAHPGVQGPRHWPRSFGDRIAFLMKDDSGLVQLWTIGTNGGEPVQLSHHLWNIASAFTWNPNGSGIAHVMDGSVFITDARTGEGRRLTSKAAPGCEPRPEACVFSPDGSKIAYVKPVNTDGRMFNQIFVVEVNGR